MQASGSNWQRRASATISHTATAHRLTPERSCIRKSPNDEQALRLSRNIACPKTLAFVLCRRAEEETPSYHRSRADRFSSIGWAGQIERAAKDQDRRGNQDVWRGPGQMYAALVT